MAQGNEHGYVCLDARALKGQGYNGVPEGQEILDFHVDMVKIWYLRVLHVLL